jgi:hypothetical protein
MQPRLAPKTGTSNVSLCCFSLKLKTNTVIQLSASLKILSRPRLVRDPLESLYPKATHPTQATLSSSPISFFSRALEHYSNLFCPSIYHSTADIPSSAIGIPSLSLLSSELAILPSYLPAHKLSLPPSEPSFSILGSPLPPVETPPLHQKIEISLGCLCSPNSRLHFLDYSPMAASRNPG